MVAALRMIFYILLVAPIFLIVHVVLLMVTSWDQMRLQRKVDRELEDNRDRSVS